MGVHDYTPADEAELTSWLVELGAGTDQIEGALRGHGPEALASDIVLDRDATLSAREVAERTALPLARIEGMFHQLGVAIPDLDAPQFSAADLVLAQRLASATGQGIVRGPDLLRVIAGAMERIAEAAVAVYVQGPEEALRRRQASALVCAEATLSATELALDLGTGLGPIFRHHMRQAVARQRVIQEGVSRRELARLAVGFVDLVGSTELQAGLDVDALGAQVSRFEARAFEVTALGGGRLVKFIGDEIMVAAADPLAACHIVGDLIDAFTEDGTQPRAGLVFGEVLFRHGDYYGPVVNLAARLVDAAIPGEALVETSVVEAVKEDGLAFEPAGRRMLKGFDAPVSVWSLAIG
jgi:adenylate cyclase